MFSRIGLKPLMVCSALLALAQLAPAQTKVAVVNLQRAVFESAEIKKADLQMQATFKPRQDRIAQLQKEGKKIGYPGLTAGVTCDPATGDVYMVVCDQGLWLSGDGGKTFASFALPSTMSGRRPFIAAVDPRNADTVYVRFDVQGTSPLAVTHDGGKSFVRPLTTTVSLAGFALSPDGKTVIASNAYDGTFRADADTLVFTAGSVTLRGLKAERRRRG